MDYLRTERADVLDNLISSNENIVKCGVNDETIKYLDECYKLYEKKRVKSKESGDLKELLRLDYLILNYKRDICMFFSQLFGVYLGKRGGNMEGL